MGETGLAELHSFLIPGKEFACLVSQGIIQLFYGGHIAQAKGEDEMETINTTTVNVPGYGNATATPKMMVRFDEMNKKDLAKKIANAIEKKEYGVTFWRALPKETLVVVVADLLATDEERERTKDPVPAPQPSIETPQGQASGDAPIVAPAGGYRLRCTALEGWLRRDQPRKPGDKATWKRVEDVSKASIYRTLRQAEAKVAEVAGLYDDRDHQAVLEAIS